MIMSKSKCVCLALSTQRESAYMAGWPIIRVVGERARDALAKGVPIDLHPQAFRPGDAAATTVSHIGAHLWQVDDTPIYEFIVLRSFAPTFWDWLMASAAQYGVLIANE